MSQRNPMNDRYTTEDRKGVARKSAASAKPKTKAAASVTIKETKTPQEKKAAAKAARKKEQDEQRHLDRMYYKPDTVRYRHLRQLWWLCLGCAVVVVAIMFLARAYLATQAFTVLLILAYVFIIAAFYIDFSKIRKERREYQERMVRLEAEQEKQKKAAEHRAKQQQSQAQSHRRRRSGRGRGNRGGQAQVAAEAADAADDSGSESSSPADSSGEAPKRGFLGRLLARDASSGGQASRQADN